MIYSPPSVSTDISYRQDKSIYGVADLGGTKTFNTTIMLGDEATLIHEL